MGEIIILDELPIVLTKKVWVPDGPADSGAVIILPNDAVLVRVQPRPEVMVHRLPEDLGTPPKPKGRRAK